MEPSEVDVEELRRWTHDPGSWRPTSPVVVVDLDGVDAVGGDRRHDRTDGTLPFGLPAVVVGISPDAAARPGSCDLVLGVDEADLIDDVVGTVGCNPIASRALVALLRVGSPDVAAGLLAESATYASLQTGEEFRRWRSARPRRAVGGGDQPVLARRDGDVLHVTLHRPERRNALDVSMRDALAEVLELALVDRSIGSIVLDGAGDSFCSGGDLDEFGTAPAPAIAHLVRLERHLGSLLHAVRDRLTVHLHGAAFGSGIEMAAFAHRVVATGDLRIGLPEVSMGLIPGAGGTVSLTRRVGRHRLCRLALTGEHLDLQRAVAWGLVDEVPAGQDRR